MLLEAIKIIQRAYEGKQQASLIFSMF